jgi:hypothetical protein
LDFFSRRCFFRATPLPPGHKLALWQEKRIAKVKVSKTLFLPDGGLCDSIPGENSKSEVRISKQIEMLEVQGGPF